MKKAFSPDENLKDFSCHVISQLSEKSGEVLVSCNAYIREQSSTM